MNKKSDTKTSSESFNKPTTNNIIGNIRTWANLKPLPAANMSRKHRRNSASARAPEQARQTQDNDREQLSKNNK